jgi:hypothetical protein
MKKFSKLLKEILIFFCQKGVIFYKIVLTFIKLQFLMRFFKVIKIFYIALFTKLSAYYIQQGDKA